MKSSFKNPFCLLRHARLGLVVSTAVLSISSPSASALTQVWTAGATGNFGDSTKYASGVAPVTGDTVSSDGTSTINFDATNSISLAALNLNITSGATTFNQTAGNLSLGTLGFGGAGGSRNPTYNMSGGTLSIATSFSWGNGTNARFNVSAGTVDYSGISLSIGVANGAKGSIIMTGGVFNANSVSQINLANINAAGAQAVVDLSGDAKFNATASTFVVGQFGAATGTGVFATLNMAGTSQLNTSTVVLGGNNAASAVYGVINLNGGTISTGSIRKGTSTIAASSTANVLHADGGTIKALTHANNSNFLLGTFVNLKAGGLAFDTNGNTVGISNVMSGTGGLTKANTAGTLTLSGVNTYTGGTIVNGGTLALSVGGGDGAIRGALTINSGASVNLTASNALGFNTGAKVNSIAVNGGTLSAANGTGDQGWGIAYTLTGGTVQSNGGVSDAAATSNLTLDSNSSVSTLASATTSTIAGRLVLRGDNGGNINITVADGAAATDLLVSAAITNKVGFAAAGFTKLGAGVMSLTGSSNYTGATAVESGKLVVSGSIGNSAVTVTGTNTTLASGTTGTIGSSVTINSGAILAAGDVNAAGTATVVGAGTFNDGSIFSWDISGDGASFDKLVGASLVDGGGAGASIFRIVAADSSFSDSFWNSGTRTWENIFTTDGSASIADWANIFTTVEVLNSSGGSVTPVNGSFSVSGNTLTWSAVPEPSTVLAALLMGAGLLRRRR